MIGSGTGSRTGSRTGSMAGSKAGSMAGSMAGSKAGSMTGSRADTVFGSFSFLKHISIDMFPKALFLSSSLQKASFQARFSPYRIQSILIPYATFLFFNNRNIATPRDQVIRRNYVLVIMSPT
jgi:hypothetical protein